MAAGGATAGDAADGRAIWRWRDVAWLCGDPNRWDAVGGDVVLGGATAVDPTRHCVCPLVRRGGGDWRGGALPGAGTADSQLAAGICAGNGRAPPTHHRHRGT
ncbi:hypothetical protein DC030_15365, partial [Enterococcus faecalis]